MSEGDCKKCGVDLAGQYSEVTENRELVIVDKQTEQPLVLHKGDKLCSACGSSQAVDYYYRAR